MKLKLRFTFALFFSIGVFTATAQAVKKQQPLTVINYGETINAPLTAKELSFIKEAYGENAEKYILNNPQRVKDIKHIFRNRVTIQEYKNKDLSSVKLLSTVPKINKNASVESTINANTFNALNYDFNFYTRSTEILTYRVDNTSYLITIKPQHH